MESFVIHEFKKVGTSIGLNVLNFFGSYLDDVLSL